MLKDLFLKECLLDALPLGFSETSIYFLIFSCINPLVLQKSELSMKASHKAVSIP